MFCGKKHGLFDRQVLVATPGRLQDFLGTGEVDLWLGAMVQRGAGLVSNEDFLNKIQPLIGEFPAPGRKCSSLSWTRHQLEDRKT